jgi:uncharacterized protein (AIM24 family)
MTVAAFRVEKRRNENFFFVEVGTKSERRIIADAQAPERIGILASAQGMHIRSDAGVTLLQADEVSYGAHVFRRTVLVGLENESLRARGHRPKKSPKFFDGNI